MIVNQHLTTNQNWLPVALEQLSYVGFSVVENVLEPASVEECRDRMYTVQQKIWAEVGKDRLHRAGELGILRLMMLFDPFFLKFLQLPQVLAVIDATVSETCILHLQNGFILPPFPPGETPNVFQNQFHQDFRRVLNGYMTSINVMFTISDFTYENGGTLVVPGSHQKSSPPSTDYCHDNAIPIECPAGSMILFDSTLWHASGMNVSGQDRLGINHQFTRSYLKQQIDYCRALDGTGLFEEGGLPARTQQLLGWYTRVVTSLDEYYQPSEKRLYRGGQG